MSEGGGKNNPKWDLMNARLDNFRLKVRFATEGFIHDTKFKAMVSKEEQVKASEMSEVFAGEVMGFIKENPSGILKPLQPTREQMGLVYFLLDSIEQEDLVLEETNGRIQKETGRSYLAKVYKTSQNQGEDDFSSRVKDFFTKKEATLVIRYDVSTQSPVGFAMLGNMGMTSVKTMDFLVFPEKVETSGQVEDHLGIIKSKDYSVGVYQKGERIVLDRSATHKGEEYNMTDQYYLVGAFDGEGSRKTYWIYGKNDDKHHKMSVRGRVGSQQFATQKDKD